MYKYMQNFDMNGEKYVTWRNEILWDLIKPLLNVGEPGIYSCISLENFWRYRLQYTLPVRQWMFVS